MQRAVVVGLVVAALTLAGTAAGQQGTRPQSQPPIQAGAGGPVGEPSLTIPTGQFWLGNVRIPRAVMIDGQRLPAGTYRLRMTGETAQKDAPGQSEQLQRWVEFVQGTNVRGRTMATVVPKGEIAGVADRNPPGQGQSRVEVLKGDDYLRVWMNRGDHVLLHLPIAGAS